MTNVPKTVRRLPIGAEVQPGGFVYFRVWAPKRQAVQVVIRDPDGKREMRRAPLESEEGGYFSTICEAPAGARYAFLVDGDDRPLPDPASRFQPDGPEGFSQVIDPASFHWSDAEWPGVKPQGQVFYEVHIGTFTPEGTWEAAAGELPDLARLGITTLEIMPLADFPGEFGWGYDGVSMFAPTRLYGRPDDFRRFVDAAHALGLGVILDVVYNHFGNFGNMLGEFSDDFTTDRYPNEWGKAINFDGANSAGVREYFLANVRYWIEEFHLDGYRLDATHAIHDASDDHILAAIAREARQAAGRRGVLLVSENEPQDAKQVRGPDEGGYGLDMAWNDDFHHSAVVRLTGHNEAYYHDYFGHAEEFVAAVKHGFLYQGQYYSWQGKRRGTRTDGLPAWAFVNFLENHDQVANSATGRRLHALASPGCYRAMTTLWLLAPQTPLFFQGQEFASSRDFQFFADVPAEYRRAVGEGRAAFLAQFPSIDTPQARARLADPTTRATFERCKLDVRERAMKQEVYRLHQDLLRLRREDPVFRQQRRDLIDGATLSPDCLLLRYAGGSTEERLLIVNFGCDLLVVPAPRPLLAPPPDHQWKLVFSSEDVAYGGSGAAPINEQELLIPGAAAVVLAPALDREERRSLTPDHGHKDAGSA